jgi:hypothetical protein
MILRSASKMVRVLQMLRIKESGVFEAVSGLRPVSGSNAPNDAES